MKNASFSHLFPRTADSIASPFIINKNSPTFIAMLHDETTQQKKSLRILYADDLRELRDVARIALSREGHLIDCVCDGQEALDRIAADPNAYDLLMTDHHMPNLDGLELVTKVRTLPFEGKILVFSSELSPSVSDAYNELKVDRIVFKPVFPSELRAILSDMFTAMAYAH
jgi:CheY-like chemotaxis protein